MPIHLTPMERHILHYLQIRTGQLVTNEELYIFWYGYDGEPITTRINQCIMRLRRKLGYSLIGTVIGKGFIYSPSADQVSSLFSRKCHR